MTSQLDFSLGNTTIEVEENLRFWIKNKTNIQCVTSLVYDVITHEIAYRVTSWVMTYVLVPYLLLRLSCWLWERRILLLQDFSSEFPLPGGRMGFPLVGEMFHILVLGSSYQRRRRKEFGKIYRTHIWGSPTIVVIGGENVRKILLGEGKLVRTQWPSTTRRILGTDGIVNGNQQTHQTIKKLALKAFSPKYMGLYAPVIKAGVIEHLKTWQKCQTMSVLEACKQMVSQTMMTVLLGIKSNDPDLQLYINAADNIINSILTLPLDFPGSTFRKGLQAREFIFRQLESNLRSKLSSNDEDLMKEESESVLVNIIKLSRLESNSNISLKNLQNLSLEFIFAGTQSLQCSSALMIVHLSQRPKIVERLREEIIQQGLWEIPLHDIDCHKLETLPLLDAVVKETLRVTPTIPGAIRVALKTFQLGGFQIPRGWQVVYSIRMTHEEISGNVLQDGPVCQFDPDIYFNCAKCNQTTGLDPGANETSCISDNSKGHVTRNGARMCHNNVTCDTKCPTTNGDILCPTHKAKKSLKNINKTKNHICHNTADPYNFIPFGKGNRMCAGQNYGLLFLRCLAFQLVKTSNIELMSKCQFVEIPMTKPHRNVKVKLKPFNLNTSS